MIMNDAYLSWMWFSEKTKAPLTCRDVLMFQNHLRRRTPTSFNRVVNNTIILSLSFLSLALFFFSLSALRVMESQQVVTRFLSLTVLER